MNREMINVAMYVEHAIEVNGEVMLGYFMSRKDIDRFLTTGKLYDPISRFQIYYKPDTITSVLPNIRFTTLVIDDKETVERSIKVVLSSKENIIVEAEEKDMDCIAAYMFHMDSNCSKYRLLYIDADAKIEKDYSTEGEAEAGFYVVAKDHDEYSIPILVNGEEHDFRFYNNKDRDIKAYLI